MRRNFTSVCALSVSLDSNCCSLRKESSSKNHRCGPASAKRRIFNIRLPTRALGFPSLTSEHLYVLEDLLDDLVRVPLARLRQLHRHHEEGQPAGQRAPPANQVVGPTEFPALLHANVSNRKKLGKQRLHTETINCCLKQQLSAAATATVVKLMSKEHTYITEPTPTGKEDHCASTSPEICE